MYSRGVLDHVSHESGTRRVSLLRAESHRCRSDRLCCIFFLLSLCLSLSPLNIHSLHADVCQELEAEKARAIAEEEAANLAREEEVRCQAALVRLGPHDEPRRCVCSQHVLLSLHVCARNRVCCQVKMASFAFRFVLLNRFYDHR